MQIKERQSMKQLTLISPIVEQRNKPITKKNESAMKKCYTDCFNMGMVSSETFNKVLNTSYVR